MPEKFNTTVINKKGTDKRLKETSENNYESYNDEASEHVEISLPNNSSSHTFEASYNIAPTNNAVIIYLTKPHEKNISFHYNIELLKFGLLPDWAKPKDAAAVKRGDGHGPKYSKEVQRAQSKYFNCRKESLGNSLPVWNSARKSHRCVVPIQGYFEWLKTKNDKIPYFIHSKNSPLIFLAGLYSHNTHYNETDMVEKGEQYFSSFTIITGPADKTDSKDLSWLHNRKPIMIEPGSKEWFEWLDPEKAWDEKFLETSLNTHNNIAYRNIEGYVVSKDVGKPGNKSEKVIKEEKKKQEGIMLFFTDKQRKRESQQEKDEDHASKKMKTERKGDGETQLTDKKNVMKAES